MWKPRLKTAAALFLAFCLACYGVLYFFVRSDWFRLRAESELSRATGHEVRIGTLRLTPWLGWVAADLSVAKNGKPVFRSARIAGFVLPWNFFNGRIGRLSLEQPEIYIALRDLFDSSQKTSLEVSVGTLNIADGALVLETEDGAPFVLRSISLEAENVNLGEKTGLRLHAHVPAVSGTATASVSGDADEKRIEISVAQADEKGVTRLLPNRAAKPVLKAEFQMKKRDGGDGYEVNGSGSADQFRLGTGRIDGQFDARMELDGKSKDALLWMDLKMPQLPEKLLPAELSLGAVSATLQGGYSAATNILTFKNIAIASAGGASLAGQGTISLGEEPADLNIPLRLRNVELDQIMKLAPEPLRDWTYTGKASADMKLTGAYNAPAVAGVAWTDRSNVRGNDLAVARMALKLPFRWAHAAFEIKAGRIQGSNLIWNKKDKIQFKIREASLAGDVAKEPGKPLRMATDFQIVAGDFSVPGESKAGERLNAKGLLACEDCAGSASFRGEATVESLDLLWNRFFGDFKTLKPAVTVAGAYHREADELRFDKLRLVLGSGGHLDLKGSVGRLHAEPAYDLEIRSDDLRYTPLYDFFVRDTFKTGYPILGRIGVSGKSAVSIRAQGSLGAFNLDGRLRLEQAGIHERSGRWRIGPISLDLPLQLRFPEAAADKTAQPKPGRLVIEEIRTQTGAVPKIAVPVVLWNNSLRFPEPIRIALFGGKAVIEDLVWRDVAAAPKDLSFSLVLSDLALLDLTDSLGWYRFGGTLSGSIPQVRWAGDSLRSDGTIVLNLFGGQAVVRGMAVERPFSPLRSIAMDAVLEGLNLEQASETFEFGRISGALSGTIDGLVVTQGQPAAFSADIHTIERPGIDQWISVEALNKITVLSSGNEAGAVYGGIAGFFDFFRYSKLGFKASLKNDKLMLRGIETRNGQEYLVVGTVLPPTVNIVSHTQEIGFSELMSRLKRIQRTGNSD